MQIKIETIKKQSKIGPKGFLNDVIGTKKLEVWKNFFPKCSKFNKKQKTSRVLGLKMKLKVPKIKKTAKNRYLA